jgi:P63C domain
MQLFRSRKALQLKLRAFIADEMQEWVRMFSTDFWFALARLEGIHYSPQNRPLPWRRYIMAFVYDAIDGDVGKKLREIKPDPHFEQIHRQWLSEFGTRRLNDHLQRAITIMKLCDDMSDFKRKFARVFKKSPLQMEFSRGED